MHASQLMRENASLTRAKLQNDMAAQRRATEFALRKRTHSEEQSRHELEWQLKITEDEISEMEGDIRALDKDLQVKTSSLKLAHTRLENRTCRPGMDLCRDQVQLGLVEEVHQLQAAVKALDQKLTSSLKLAHTRLENRTCRPGMDLCRDQVQLGLVEEVRQLEAAIKALDQKLVEAQHSLQKLSLHRARMTQDLSRKQDALTLEQRSLSTRHRLTDGVTAATHTDATVVGDKPAVAGVVPLTNSSGRSILKTLA
ncbi:hypothetical protein CRUP_019091 [Coryphaenoides rupestris]|nr:hypothetical protein CRUP_019091 [Coryphaenoides rupestris]